jgi:hypothetical protein
VSDEIIFHEIELKVMQVVEQLRAAGAPLAEWEWSRKPRTRRSPSCSPSAHDRRQHHDKLRSG